MKQRANFISAASLGLALLSGATLAQEKKSAMATPKSPDAQMQAVLDELAALHPKPIETLSAEEARKQPSPADAVKALLKKKGQSTAPEPVGKVDDRSIDGPAGKIPIRIYSPSGTGPFAVLVYWHGGGWVIADLDTYDSSPRALANAAGVIVVSCHYRQAPEHPFPAAADDAFAAYQWVLKNAASFNGDPMRVAVAGESAGGNLATVTAMQARDKNVRAPAYQVLVYPVTDHAFDTPSYRENAKAKPLNKAMMEWFWAKYAPSSAEANNPYASPLRAGNLKGLPAATVIAAEIDPLRSEGKAYADKLRAAGANVTYELYPGVTHEFFGMGAVVDKAKQAVAKAADGLKTALRR